MVGENTSSTVYQACAGRKGAGNSMTVTYPNVKNPEVLIENSRMNKLNMPIAFCVTVRSTKAPVPYGSIFACLGIIILCSIGIMVFFWKPIQTEGKEYEDYISEVGEDIEEHLVGKNKSNRYSYQQFR